MRNVLPALTSGAGGQPAPTILHGVLGRRLDVRRGEVSSVRLAVYLQGV